MILEQTKAAIQHFTTIDALTKTVRKALKQKNITVTNQQVINALNNTTFNAEINAAITAVLKKHVQQLNNCLMYQRNINRKANNLTPNTINYDNKCKATL